MDATALLLSRTLEPDTYMESWKFSRESKGLVLMHDSSLTASEAFSLPHIPNIPQTEILAEPCISEVLLIPIPSPSTGNLGPSGIHNQGFVRGLPL